ncbi:hypothetical protein HY572_02705 [Candidatus Micrarchaeota archaeon]|nr:hypothetical protein [Candidatus Micrarchaeota archaeon]
MSIAPFEHRRFRINGINEERYPTIKRDLNGIISTPGRVRTELEEKLTSEYVYPAIFKPIPHPPDLVGYPRHGTDRPFRAMHFAALADFMRALQREPPTGKLEKPGSWLSGFRQQVLAMVEELAALSMDFRIRRTPHATLGASLVQSRNLAETAHHNHVAHANVWGRLCQGITRVTLRDGEAQRESIGIHASQIGLVPLTVSQIAQHYLGFALPKTRLSRGNRDARFIPDATSFSFGRQDVAHWTGSHLSAVELGQNKEKFEKLDADLNAHVAALKAAASFDLGDRVHLHYGLYLAQQLTDEKKRAECLQRQVRRVLTVLSEKLPESYRNPRK